MSATVLLADDDEGIRSVLTRAIRGKGYKIRATGNPTELWQWVEKGEGDLVISDVMMPGMDGLTLLGRIRETRPTLPVIIISARSTLKTAVESTQKGAFEYLPKPFDLQDLLGAIHQSLKLSTPVHAAPSSTPEKEVQLIGNSPAMQEIYRTLARLVDVDLTVMIYGESGTGKELVARALHDMGKRKAAPFIAVNMAAIPKELIESELFGHEKGAFTGALTRKAGRFEQAKGGTLFLDEIGDMPIEAQTRLLRVLQEGEYTAVGGTKTYEADARIICATHRDLKRLVKQGAFREDLYYRLNVVPMRIPSLRERKADIQLLTEFFLAKALERGLPSKQLSEEAYQALTEYEWPGNVRELENLVYRLAALRTEDIIGLAALQSVLEENRQGKESGAELEPVGEFLARQFNAYFKVHGGDLPPSGLYDRVLKEVEIPLISATLRATQGNQVKAAEVLGLNRNTLRKRMTELGILAKDFE